MTAREPNALSPTIKAPSIGEIWREPYTYQSEDSVTRFLFKLMNTLMRPFVGEIHGNIDLIGADAGPFVLVLNHNQRLEAIAAPAILYHFRQGKPIHFLADWNFMVVPFVAALYRHAQVILITRKIIRPRFLEMMKPLFTSETPPFDRALAKLRAGAPVAIFPEGTMNRDSKKMMRGLPGAAKLSLEAGVPVIPIGIRFPDLDPSKPISDLARMDLHIGKPVDVPDLAGQPPSRRLILDFHAEIMTALAALSGKTWHPDANKRRRYESRGSLRHQDHDDGTA